MRVLVAPDKFKGSLTAVEAATCIADGWREIFPGDDISLHPVADGGDGTLEAVAGCLGGRWMTTATTDARGRPSQASWLWEPESRAAWIESARVCGLATLEPHELDPLTATSAGLASMISAAIAEGAQTIFLCLGGSATNDGGSGMASALGFTFRNAGNTAFEPVPNALPQLASIERPPTIPRVKMIALTDVRSPLLGLQGASHTYGPQKGAAPGDVVKLDAALDHLARIAARDLRATDPGTPGAGAAGGLGFGAMAFLDADLRNGFDTIAAMTHLEADIARADIVITGEGKIDAQTASGKAPAGVAHLARVHGKPVIAFAGSTPLAADAAFDVLVPLANSPMTIEDSVGSAGPLLQAAAARVARLVRVGKTL